MDATPSYSLNDFVTETSERDNPGHDFELESTKMLEINLKGRVWKKIGSMIAYRGSVKFIREGMLEGGIGKAFMKALSGEVTPLTKVEGTGKVYVADAGKDISVLRLENTSINVSGNDLLAFQDSVKYSVTMHKKVSGMLSGGLFSVRLEGSGLVAITTHGRPLTLRVTPHDPVMTDPNSTVAWSANLSPELKTDITMKALLGRGGGETFQMMFQGDG
ncbi:MAG: AIM24 family protein, partial [Armatimonadota bacterium]